MKKHVNISPQANPVRIIRSLSNPAKLSRARALTGVGGDQGAAKASAAAEALALPLRLNNQT